MAIRNLGMGGVLLLFFVGIGGWLVDWENGPHLINNGNELEFWMPLDTLAKQVEEVV